MMKIQLIADKLAPESIVWPGFGLPTQVNLNLVTGDDITPDSNALEPLIKLLNAAYLAQTDLNVIRDRDGLPALDMLRRTVSVDENENPVFTYSLSAKIDSNAALNNVSAPVVTGED